MSNSVALVADLLRSQALKDSKSSPLHLVATSPSWLKWIQENLSPTEQGELADSWAFKARHKQMPPPGDWRFWIGITGRGTGKNLVASHFGHRKALENPGREGYLAARTRAQAISAIVMHPECGLLATQLPENPCEFRQKNQVWQVRWKNGAYAGLQTAEEPEGGRSGHYAWGINDEIATWKRKVDIHGATLWENLDFALRAGPNPQAFGGTTPRPVELVRMLINAALDPTSGVVVYRESLLDNAANHPINYVKSLLRQYRGTRLYRQEIEGELLNDLENAILNHDLLNADRVEEADLPEMERIVIGCDPAFTSNKKSDDTGIVVVGRGVDGHCYAIENRTFKGTPDQVGKELIRLSYKHDHAAIVPESNGAGDWITSTIYGCIERGAPKPRVLPRNASQSKAKRAGPILGYHERHEAHLVGDDERMRALADQLCLFTVEKYEGYKSPNDADAYVHGAGELMLNQGVSWDEMVRINAHGG